jgi:L-amino acid N-acyltransferase YncA
MIDVRFLYDSMSIHYRGVRDQPAEETFVRPATVDDLDAVAGIFAHYAAHSLATFEEGPLPPEAWRSRHRASADLGLPFLVATAHQRAVGYAYAGPWRPQPAYRHTVEDSVYLAPGWTRRGLGRRLPVGFKHGRWVDTLLLQRDLTAC